MDSDCDDEVNALALPALNSRTWRHPSEVADAQRQVEQCLSNIFMSRQVPEQTP